MHTCGREYDATYLCGENSHKTVHFGRTQTHRHIGYGRYGWYAISDSFTSDALISDQLIRDNLRSDIGDTLLVSDKLSDNLLRVQLSDEV